jgi:hypothetical protein
MSSRFSSFSSLGLGRPIFGLGGPDPLLRQGNRPRAAVTLDGTRFSSFSSLALGCPRFHFGPLRPGPETRKRPCEAVTPAGTRFSSFSSLALGCPRFHFGRADAPHPERPWGRLAPRKVAPWLRRGTRPRRHEWGQRSRRHRAIVQGMTNTSRAARDALERASAAAETEQAR